MRPAADAKAQAEVARPVPAPDRISRNFWEAARDGRLVVQRCRACRRYHHPPVEYCDRCLSVELGFEEVSGRGTLYSYTEARSGARSAYFRDLGPYLIALVELEEQAGLLMYTNLPGARLEQLRVGMPVGVVFEQVGDDIALPQFRLIAGPEAAA